MEELTHEQLHTELQRFTGSVEYFAYNGVYLTEGVRYLAERAQCFWLLDIIWSIHAMINTRERVICRLEMKEGNTAIFTATEYLGEAIYIQEVIAPDFPAKFVEIYVADGLLYLAREG